MGQFQRNKIIVLSLFESLYLPEIIFIERDDLILYPIIGIIKVTASDAAASKDRP